MKAGSGKELCRALERRGWVLARISSSHHICVRPGVPFSLAVPVHGNRTLKTGLQHILMKAAGLTERDL